MPLSIPAFSQYQAPLIPLPGLWNRAPVEGDKKVNAEIDWASVNSPAVQFNLSGNSPVALSQIVALCVDNGYCGGDCAFIFPDSSFRLIVPAHAQGVFPVFTNALMFYVSAPLALGGDQTIIQIFNSMPPPITMLQSEAWNRIGVAGIALNANSTTPILPGMPGTPGISTGNGTLTSVSINVAMVTGASAGSATLALVDGSAPPGPRTLWAASLALPASQSASQNFSQQLGVRYMNGVSLVISGTTFTGGTVSANLYYTSP